MTDRLDRMAAGYGAPSADSPLAQKLARKQAEAAARFVEDPAMERILKWRESDDPRYGQLDAHLKVMAGYYARDRAAAKELAR